MEHENKTTENMTNSNKSESSNKAENSKLNLNVTDFWHDKKNKDLLFYLVVGIFMLELIIAVAAFFYGIVNATPGENGLPPRFQFPLVAYAISAVVAPAIFLLIVHLLGIGLFRSLKRSPVEDAAWRKNLPERIQKIYTIVHGAPTALLLVGIVALGIALFYIDGAMQALLRLGSVLEGYLLWIIGSIVLVWCISYMARIWFKYRLKKLESEYQYRRDIFESSGIVIVDKGCIQLPPSAVELNTSKMLAGGQGELIEIGSLEQEDDKNGNDKKSNFENVIDIIAVTSMEEDIHNVNNNSSKIADAKDNKSEANNSNSKIVDASENKM